MKHRLSIISLTPHEDQKRQQEFLADKNELSKGVYLLAKMLSKTSQVINRFSVETSFLR